MSTTSTTTLEREIKLRFGSVDEARAAILACGATPMLGRRLENGKSRLTFKGPVQPGVMKIREELETVIGDGEILLRVLKELGLHVWFRYEKYREEFAHEDVIVAVDETPVGIFVEIEGSESGIAAMAGALGQKECDYIKDSYRGLFLRHREAFGIAGPDMVFDESDAGS